MTRSGPPELERKIATLLVAAPANVLCSGSKTLSVVMKLLLSVLLYSSAFAWVPPTSRSPRGARLSLSATSMGNQITVVTDPPQADLDKLGVSDWPTWGCEVSKFPWTYEDKETCFLLAGRVTVTPDGGQPVTFEKGDLVTFPQGMSCVWDVHEAVSKHFKFGD